MANVQQLIAMIRSHASGDGRRFLAVAEEIATDAERAGKVKVAANLMKAVNASRPTALPEPPTPLARPPQDLIGIVSVRYASSSLADVTLPHQARAILDRVALEQRERDRLTDRGLQPRRKLLFHGPPGTGKTFTANALAGELSLPIVTVQLDGIFSKYMGEAALKLNRVFEMMQAMRGVYFFDEVDALASERASDQGNGEARRLLNSLLQFLDSDTSTSLILAATNSFKLIDSAVSRRFDVRVQYDLPGNDEIRSLVTGVLKGFPVARLGWKSILAAAAHCSQHDVVASCLDAARDTVLEGDRPISTADLVGALTRRRASLTVPPDRA